MKVLGRKGGYPTAPLDSLFLFYAIRIFTNASSNSFYTTFQNKGFSFVEDFVSNEVKNPIFLHFPLVVRAAHVYMIIEKSGIRELEMPEFRDTEIPRYRDTENP